MKMFFLLRFTVLIFTLATEVTDEDLNSYILAIVQQLESKIMVRPNTRNTRQTTDKPTKTPVVADNKQCTYPPSSVVTYTRWGNSICPYGADTVPSTLE